MPQPPEPSAEDIEFYRWYGPWAPYTPAQVAEALREMPARWWIVGGWAVQAFTGAEREHEDIDVAFLREDLPVVLDHLLPDLCVWTNLKGTIRPLRKPEDLIEGSRQLWVRRDGVSPWVMDLAMSPHEGETWVAPRDPRIRRPLADALFQDADGVHYLRPELVLFMKALLARPKDEADLQLCLPLMAAADRAFLREAIEVVHPGHQWLGKIER